MAAPSTPSKEGENVLHSNRCKYANRVFTNTYRQSGYDKYKVLRCCHCLTHVVITDADLTKLPRRRTDNSFILICKDIEVLKLYTQPLQKPLKIRREKGIETQYIHICPQCSCHVAYQSVPINSPIAFKTNPQGDSHLFQQRDTGKRDTCDPYRDESDTGERSWGFLEEKASKRSKEDPGEKGNDTTEQNKDNTDEKEDGKLRKSNLSGKLEENNKESREEGTIISIGQTTSKDDSFSKHSRNENGDTDELGKSTGKEAFEENSTDSKKRKILHETDHVDGDKDFSQKKILKDSEAQNSLLQCQYIYLIEKNVLFPKLEARPTFRCRVCGYVARNQQLFEDHKRERGHQDQEKGSFSAVDLKQDSPVNAIIIG